MKSIILLFLATLIAGCDAKLPGTNTGNPGMGYNSPVIGETGALLLGYTICAKIKSCYASSSFDSCITQVSTLANYTVELGSTANAFSTLTDLHKAEDRHQVNPNQNNFTQCEQAIQRLSCSDHLVQNAYVTSSPANFASTNILFRSASACALIY